MATVTTTTTLGTSNLRGASRQTRNNPTRTSRNSRPNLRQNSLISNAPPSAQITSEPHGFYPAISHFTDAILALPRDYRRHISLLKEVDAKAWFPEDSLHALLEQCLSERQTRPAASNGQPLNGSNGNAVDDAVALSATNSVDGALFDSLSQCSVHVIDPALVPRRQLYQMLRMNLMQMMVTMDEKNHVIDNANEDLARHIRRLDDVLPHILQEISDDARLGSLKHWAYTDLNPPKKFVAATTRRDVPSGLAILVDNDIAHRSESRREAMLAKKERITQPADSDFDEKLISRKTILGKGKKTDIAVEALPPIPAGAGKRRKPEKGAGGAAMERSTSGLRAGAVSMSREPSQQEASKKRKALTTAATVARKRLNINPQESPKLTSSPLANATGKDAVKRSPALPAARPVGRGRQNSAQTSETSRNRPSSSASYRNPSGLGINGDAFDIKNLASATRKTTADVKSTMKEYTNEKGAKLVEDISNTNGESGMRGVLLLEHSASGRGSKREAAEESKYGPSPRSVPASLANESKFGARGRASKTSTPVVATFAEADGDDSGGANGSENGHSSSTLAKLKRAPRPRMKDHHGLQDSLSPKGLPMKRTHGKTLSMSSMSGVQATNNRPSSSRARPSEREEEVQVRTSSRSHQSASQSTATSSSVTMNIVKSPEAELDEEEFANEEEDELRYCYCDGVSYGEMVACDNKNCPREWFHLECIGLKSLPKSAKWYCDECKDNLVKKGRFGSNGNGSGER